ncbi:MAG TPA: MFS transporter [Deltaproteobacteria bacterium]|nr:MFS transporter [Deltaproteobacteria bacterium]
MPTAVDIPTLFRRNRDFRYLFSARLVSLFGDWFNTLAVLALLRSLGHTGAADFGWVVILKTLPTLVASPVAGVVADRLPRRQILVAADAVRAAIVLAMLFSPNVEVLYLLVALQSMASAFFEPARTALLPDIVRPEELTAANAIGAAAWSTMLALGAGIGGLVTAYLGWSVALGLDVVTYLVSAMLLFQVTVPARDRPQRPTDWRTWTGLRDIQAGFAFLRDHPRVASLALVKTGWQLSGALTLVLTLLGERVFVVAGEAMLGVAVLYTARGIGTGVGPFIARWLSRENPARMEQLIAAGFVCGALFYLFLPIAPNIVVAALLVLLAHIGGATIWVFSTVRLQQITPEHVRGRVFATENASFMVAMTASTFVWGELIDLEIIGVQTIAGALGLVLLLPAALWMLRGRWLGWGTPGEAPSHTG